MLNLFTSLLQNQWFTIIDTSPKKIKIIDTYFIILLTTLKAMVSKMLIYIVVLLSIIIKKKCYKSRQKHANNSF